MLADRLSCTSFSTNKAPHAFGSPLSIMHDTIGRTFSGTLGSSRPSANFLPQSTMCPPSARQVAIGRASAGNFSIRGAAPQTRACLPSRRQVAMVPASCGTPASFSAVLISEFFAQSARLGWESDSPQATISLTNAAARGSIGSPAALPAFTNRSTATSAASALLVAFAGSDASAPSASNTSKSGKLRRALETDCASAKNGWVIVFPPINAQ